MDKTELSDPDAASLLDRAERTALAGVDSHDDWALVSELHRRGTATIHDRAVRWCASDTPSIRRLGANVLSQLGFAEGHPYRDASVPVLSQLLADRDPTVVKAALIAFGHLKAGPLDAIATLSAHASPDVRRAVAFCMGGREDDLSISTLIRLSADSEAHVRDWATFALGTLSTLDTSIIRDTLSARLQDLDPGARGEAIRGLARRHDPRVVPAILTELQRSECFDDALEAADHMPHAAFVEPLERVFGTNPCLEYVQDILDRCRRQE